MLRFRYLFEDFDMAKAFIRLWPHDEENLDEWLRSFRISSNAVYPFCGDGKTRFLRVTPVSEADPGDYEAVRDFMDYLSDHGFGVMKRVRSLKGNDAETLLWKGEAYFASVYERVPGQRLDWITNADDALMEKYGRALGRLHNLSCEYRPARPVRDYAAVLSRVEAILRDCGADQSAFDEARIVRAALDGMPRTARAFGFVHYDFEPDNVFYDADSDAFYAIDFDDGMMHFFAVDVCQALTSLDDCVPEERVEDAARAFIKGYTAEHGADAWIGHPVFERFVNLYGYARMLRAFAETFENEPEWMTELRVKVTRAMAIKRARFCSPL